MRAKWRSFLSACQSVLRYYLTPLTLSETPDFVNNRFSLCLSTEKELGRDRHAFQRVLGTTWHALGSKWEPDSKDSVVIIHVKTCRGDLDPTPEIQS